MPQSISAFQAAYISIELLIALVSVPGNVLVIWAVKVNQALRDATFCFIVSLAVADVAVGALVIPLAILINVGPQTYFHTCLMVACPVLILTQSSILALLAIAVDRYLRVKTPLRTPACTRGQLWPKSQVRSAQDSTAQRRLAQGWASPLPSSPQVQGGGDAAQGCGGHRRLLDPVLPGGPDTHVWLEQPERGAPGVGGQRQRGRARDQVRVREGHQHGVHGVLQLLRVGAAPAAAHGADIPGGLPPHPQAARQEGVGLGGRPAEVLRQGAADRQVAGPGPRPLRAQLAAPARPQLHHPLLPVVPQAQRPRLHRHLPHARQLGHEPHCLRLPHPEVPRHLP
ncbi:adenosine receptor A1 isoform X1 [Rhinolophus ferrumequinum]|uniref:adenosine receptor A1 isoform X1 n=1 Tax=Rhinolophus ferrumequinum TaxID=59479 RepID=UPI00140F9E21|nr:adenosine receptor A1 isoform X1 [Rhinolophus ferrumequinum]XP_032955438.1 adenosine receptor A1 isoform X1 [Rhinolophus ferrumequinum]